MRVGEMLDLFADNHGNIVVAKEAATELIRAGMFGDRRSARNTIYSVLNYLANPVKGNWEKVRPGVFRRKFKRPDANVQPGSNLTLLTPPAQQQAEAN